MMVARRILGPAMMALLAVSSGCFVPATQYSESLTQNRSLASQNRAQLAEIANLRQRTSGLSEQLARAEEQLAHNEIRAESSGVAPSGSPAAGLAPPLAPVSAAKLPPEIEQKMTLLAKRYPSLQLDAATGMGKLDTEIMFDSGRSELTPSAAAALKELAAILRSPEARPLKVMVVGHTDDRPPASRGAREQFPSNFHLSTARAVAVAEQLRQAGLPEYRVGVAGFTSQGPYDASTAAAERRDDRRVEIFVVAAETPILGWHEGSSIRR